MLLLSRRLTHKYAFFGLALSTLGVCACADDVATASTSATQSSSSTTSSSSSTTTLPSTTDPPTTGEPTTGDPSGSGSGGGTTGVLPDPDPCDAKPCAEAVDCCANANHPGAVCPGPYPNNWTCEQSLCVHGGCNVTADCVIDGFDCLQVGSIGRCVAPCITDQDCVELHNMPGTRCIGESATSNFCLEEIPAP